MGQQLVRVEVREFRESLTDYLDSPVPIAVTRHRHTVNCYVPARKKPDAQELQALSQAVERIASLLEEHGISEDEVFEEFEARRHAER